jgi:hypothetical protein
MIFLEDDFGYKKISVPATSDDAASDSDTKNENYVGIR